MNRIVLICIFSTFSFAQEPQIGRFDNQRPQFDRDEKMFLKGGPHGPGGPQNFVFMDDRKQPKFNNEDKLEQSTDCISIREINKQKDELIGTVVEFQAQITKIRVNPEDGKQWIQLSDNSADDKNSYIFVYSYDNSSLLEVGNVVNVQGVLDIDVNYGQGYLFPTLIRGATFKEAHY
ncbi:MAG: hypothetical protein ACK5LP_08070 [Campylobacteraceae bacterium]